MCADISSLGNLQSPEPLDLEVYADAREAPPLPKKGVYTVQAPDSFPATAFGTTKAGYLSASVDPRIVGPSNEGYVIRYTKVSAKTFKRSGISVSQLGDYLRATGRKGQVKSDPQAMADAVEQTANTMYQVEVDWRAYHKGTQWSVEGMERFPSDGNGGHTPWIEHPTEKDPISGEPVKVRAQLTVTRYIAAAN